MSKKLKIKVKPDKVKIKLKGEHEALLSGPEVRALLGALSTVVGRRQLPEEPAVAALPDGSIKASRA